MNALGFLLLLSVVSCDPYNFGFRDNPAQILQDAVEAINTHDVQKFLKVSGREVLCIYGNEDGLDYLKRNSTIDPKNAKFNLTFIKETYYDVPAYVGYWSYLNQRYMMDVTDQRDNSMIVQAVVDCDYGTEGERNIKFVNLKRSKYKRKECRVTKLIPKTFKALPLPERCGVLKVSL